MFHSFLVVLPIMDRHLASLFKLMEKLHYIYVRSFFQDHIFISQEFYESSRLLADNNFLVGRDAFLAFASDQLYDPIRVFANQKNNDCGKSFKFYSDKIDSLIFNGSTDSASVLFVTYPQCCR